MVRKSSIGTIDPPISAQLKITTREIHREVEKIMGNLLFQGELTPRNYQKLLANMYGAYRLMEAEVSKFDELKHFYPQRSKLTLLQKDLQNLYRLTGLENVFERYPFEILTPAAAWGAMYVMEGATLGGSVIRKHLLTYSFISDSCLHFFDSYGSSRGEMWQNFISELDMSHNEHLHSATEKISGAKTAFKLMKQFLDG